MNVYNNFIGKMCKKKDMAVMLTSNFASISWTSMSNSTSKIPVMVYTELILQIKDTIITIIIQVVTMSLTMYCNKNIN
jgi:hypothetical protein